MLYIHKNNILSKIKSDYKGKGKEIEEFYYNEYIPMVSRINEFIFDENHLDSFKSMADEVNSYYKKIEDFSAKNKISSQSKFASTFLEELSSYLFKDLPEIKSNTVGIFNKGIYAGLKIDNNFDVSIIKKDVDFCIGKKVNISIENRNSIDLIIPIVAVEVKTYLDATMFGEIKSSSKSIRSATPNSKTYVLMGYKCIASEHIISARQDSALNEMFCLKENEHSPIKSEVLFEYWKEIKQSISDVSNLSSLPTFGKLLNP